MRLQSKSLQLMQRYIHVYYIEIEGTLTNKSKLLCKNTSDLTFFLFFFFDWSISYNCSQIEWWELSKWLHSKEVEPLWTEFFFSILLLFQQIQHCALFQKVVQWSERKKKNFHCKRFNGSKTQTVAKLQGCKAKQSKIKVQAWFTPCYTTQGVLQTLASNCYSTWRTEWIVFCYCRSSCNCGNFNSWLQRLASFKVINWELTNSNWIVTATMAWWEERYQIDQIDWLKIQFKQ